jgi:hypothetical protein
MVEDMTQRRRRSRSRSQSRRRRRSSLRRRGTMKGRLDTTRTRWWGDGSASRSASSHRY